MKTLLVAVLSVLLSVAAQFLLKAGMHSADVRVALAEPFGLRTMIAVLSNLFVIGGFALYGLGALVWLRVLFVWDVSKAYPLVGLGFAFTVAIGWIIGEEVTLVRAVGVILICIGVFFVGRS